MQSIYEVYFENLYSYKNISLNSHKHYKWTLDKQKALDYAERIRNGIKNNLSVNDTKHNVFTIVVNRYKIIYENQKITYKKFDGRIYKTSLSGHII